MTGPGALLADIRFHVLLRVAISFGRVGWLLIRIGERISRRAVLPYFKRRASVERIDSDDGPTGRG